MQKWFNVIHTRNLRGDILGGVTAAIVSLPLALTFGPRLGHNLCLGFERSQLREAIDKLLLDADAAP